MHQFRIECYECGTGAVLFDSHFCMHFRACTASARHISGAYGFQCSWHSVYTVCLTLWQEHCSLQVLMCLVLVTRSLLTVKVSPKVHIAETASGSNAAFNASK